MQDRERNQVWGVIALVWLVAVFVVAVATRGQEVHVVEKVTSVGPTCIPPDVDGLAGVAVFRGTPTNTVWIDDNPVLESEWTPFADGRMFVGVDAEEIAGGCQTPRVRWAETLPEDTEAMRLYGGFLGFLIVFFDCDRYNHVFEADVEHVCRWYGADVVIFEDGFESGDPSNWSFWTGGEA